MGYVHATCRYKRRALFFSFLLLAAPAFAAEPACKVPPSPAVPEGKTAEARQLIAANTEVKAFIAASDQYQQCLNDWMGAEQLAATQAKKDLDPKIKAEHDRLGDENQKEKERVGGAYNAAAQAYRASHPR